MSEKTVTTSQYQKEKAARGLLSALSEHPTLECDAAVQDVVRFAQVIYGPDSMNGRTIMSSPTKTKTTILPMNPIKVQGWNAAIEAAEKIAQENALHGCEDGGEIYIAAKIAKAIGKLRRS